VALAEAAVRKAAELSERMKAIALRLAEESREKWRRTLAEMVGRGSQNRERIDAELQISSSGQSAATTKRSL
jgi:hypothetical protein